VNEDAEMKRTISLAVLVVAASSLSCTDRSSDFPEVDGWSRTGEVLTYDADNLWEYIDGAAELFVQYDVQTCRTADLAAGDLVVSVDLYDMGTPLNAFGVFKQENPAGGAPLPGAIEAAVSPPYQALLLKGATYVKVNTIGGELTDASGRELLEALARALPGSTTLPSELGLLPEDGKVAGSEGYQREGFLGLTELPGCVYAEYSEAADGTWQGFVVRLGGAGRGLDLPRGEWIHGAVPRDPLPWPGGRNADRRIARRCRRRGRRDRTAQPPGVLRPLARAPASPAPLVMGHTVGHRRRAGFLPQNEHAAAVQVSR
jgi:hypothetical protein